MFSSTFTCFSSFFIYLIYIDCYFYVNLIMHHMTTLKLICSTLYKNIIIKADEWCTVVVSLHRSLVYLYTCISIISKKDVLWINKCFFIYHSIWLLRLAGNISISSSCRCTMLDWITFADSCVLLQLQKNKALRSELLMHRIIYHIHTASHIILHIDII